jgi:glycosyltransferase involved in cell wall biosynthesis
MTGSAPSRLDVLHITYQYTPEALGGTEVYVRSLAQELMALGQSCAIAAPGARNEAYDVDGIGIYRVACSLNTEQLYGAENVDATARWIAILTRLRPHILHIHARTPMLHSAVLLHACQMGIKVIYTVHTPTAFCQRGTMLEFGSAPCDGKVSLARCGACALTALGVNKALAHSLVRVPSVIGTIAAKLVPAPLAKALMFQKRVQQSQYEQTIFFASCDHIVAVCVWIENALKINGIPGNKLSLNRQGLRTDMRQIQPKKTSNSIGPLRVFALGRADQNKGFDVLIGAINACTQLVELNLSLTVSTPADHKIAAQLQALAQKGRANGTNIHFHFNLSGAPLLDLFGASDLLAVPSIWMETGPLVVLEAFSQRLPVIGSRRGGIAELVSDQLDGWLIEPGSVHAWTAQLDAIACDRGKLVDARAAIGPVRTMKMVATEHLTLYRTVLAGDNFASTLTSKDSNETAA